VFGNAPGYFQMLTAVKTRAIPAAIRSYFATI
jgi:hypothetical protein